MLRPDSPAPAPPIVLLVDDNPDTLEMYALGLQYEGFEVRKAGDGEIALSAISTDRPDCIVADVRMPRMNGIEFRRRLTDSPETAAIPVIALTGYAAEAEILNARGAGFDCVLLKPCLPEALAREIIRVLAEKRATRPRARHASARVTQGPAKAARQQDTHAELARTDREIRHHKPQAE